MALGLCLLALFSLTGTAFLFLGFPGGTLLIFLGGLFCGLATHFLLPTPWAIGLLAGLYVAGEILDALFAAAGAQKFGASKWGIFGAFWGALAGGFLGSFFFGVGALPGLLLGIFCGAFLAEFLHRKNLLQSLKTGTGSVLGTLVSVLTKGLLGMAMLAVLVFQLIQKLK